MTIERGVLARVDRHILAKLQGAGGPKLVKLPVSDAVWDVWRRYCRLAGVSMGRGLAILLAHELVIEVEDTTPVDHPLSDNVAVHVAALEETIAEQERHLDAARARLRQSDQQIRNLHQQLRAVQEELAVTATPTAVARERVGRNEPCPCGSGLKFKLCQPVNHRLVGR